MRTAGAVDFRKQSCRRYASAQQDTSYLAGQSSTGASLWHLAGAIGQLEVNLLNVRSPRSPFQGPVRLRSKMMSFDAVSYHYPPWLKNQLILSAALAFLGQVGHSWRD